MDTEWNPNTNTNATNTNFLLACWFPFEYQRWGLQGPEFPFKWTPKQKEPTCAIFGGLQPSNTPPTQQVPPQKKAPHAPRRRSMKAQQAWCCLCFLGGTPAARERCLSPVSEPRKNARDLHPLVSLQLDKLFGLDL